MTLYGSATTRISVTSQSPTFLVCLTISGWKNARSEPAFTGTHHANRLPDGSSSSAFAGSFLGDQVYFHIGRVKGPPLLKFFTARARKFRKALRLIERYGSFVAFVSRYTYGLRILLPIILGMTNLSARRFLVLNLASALSWAILFALAGFLFGKGAALFVDDLERYEPYLLLILAGLIGCMWLSHFAAHRWHRRRARKRLRRMKASKSEDETG